MKIRGDGCLRCHCTNSVVAHGYLPGLAATGHGSATRGLRFLCSDRYSNIGCGGTFSIHWDSVIPYCSMRTVQLLCLLRAVSTSSSTYGAWAASRLIVSVQTAYRWVARWRHQTAHLRARLCLVTPPPGKADDQPDLFTLRHLVAAFPTASCPIYRMRSSTDEEKPKTIDTFVIIRLDKENSKFVARVPGTDGNEKAEQVADKLCRP